MSRRRYPQEDDYRNQRYSQKEDFDRHHRKDSIDLDFDKDESRPRELRQIVA
jgi:hypothetical protein